MIDVSKLKLWELKNLIIGFSRALFENELYSPLNDEAYEYYKSNIAELLPLCANEMQLFRNIKDIHFINELDKETKNVIDFLSLDKNKNRNKSNDLSTALLLFKILVLHTIEKHETGIKNSVKGINTYSKKLQEHANRGNCIVIKPSVQNNYYDELQGYFEPKEQLKAFISGEDIKAIKTELSVPKLASIFIKAKEDNDLIISTNWEDVATYVCSKFTTPKGKINESTFLYYITKRKKIPKSSFIEINI